ncbi:MAG: replication-associated recombination protein A [Candidatus Ancillula sp.]|jgi:putative ATPase|nr:replication-associated recombination protein A [Candidatus Ancillula sp.]
MEDLFETSFEETEQEQHHLPLAVRMRPQNLDELAGQKHLLTPGSPLRRLVSKDVDFRALPGSIVLWGPAGTGKTTIAYLIAKNSGRKFVELSAVSAGVKDVRRVIEQAKINLVREDKETILFIDEIHRFSKSQQDALLPSVENRTVILVAATTENPYFSVIGPLLSRSLVLTLQSLSVDDMRKLIERAVKDPRGLNNSVKLGKGVVDQIVRTSMGDVRKALTVLEASAGSVLGEVNKANTKTNGKNKGKTQKKPEITVEILEQTVNIAAVKYDQNGDQHYDVASAFIKSLRGSDVDAALHYLARMIVAGEDPRFIARRIMIAASEEIGMADPSALWTAVAAAQAVEKIGMPESQLILAEAVTHICLAPKSNAVTIAIGEALADVRAGLGGPVPAHLRDAHYSGAKKLGHGTEYKYAHDFPGEVVGQQYLPDDLDKANKGKPKEYYHPSEHGREKQYSESLKKLREILRDR